MEMWEVSLLLKTACEFYLNYVFVLFFLKYVKTTSVVFNIILIGIGSVLIAYVLINMEIFTDYRVGEYLLAR